MVPPVRSGFDAWLPELFVEPGDQEAREEMDSLFDSPSQAAPPPNTATPTSPATNARREIEGACCTGEGEDKPSPLLWTELLAAGVEIGVTEGACCDGEGEDKPSPLLWTSHYPKVDRGERRGLDS